MLHIQVGSLGGVIPWAKNLLSGQYLVPLWGQGWTSAMMTGRVLEAASLVIGDSALSKTEKLILHLPGSVQVGKKFFQS